MADDGTRAEDHRGPSAIRTLAVTADDVVAAVEARRQCGTRVMLRATPPYSGRMRARLHRPRETAAPNPETPGAGPDPVHVDPTALIAPDAPAYPRPADTGDELRADPDVSYTVERHHERHRAAVAEWRERVREYFVDETVVETPAGDRTVEVVVLG
jgi:hypothetical protein